MGLVADEVGSNTNMVDDKHNAGEKFVVEKYDFLSKVYSFHARWIWKMHCKKLIIFVGSSPSQGDIFF